MNGDLSGGGCLSRLRVARRTRPKRSRFLVCPTGARAVDALIINYNKAKSGMGSYDVEVIANGSENTPTWRM